MNDQDRIPIIELAVGAALADGQASEGERAALGAAAARLGVADVAGLLARGGAVDVAALVAKLSDAEARAAAYDAAAATCHADGPATPAEAAYLGRLAVALGLAPGAAAAVDAHAASIATATGTPSAGAPATPLRDHAAFIESQAVLAAALELLPERLSTLAVLPVQGRMVYRIAQSYGHSLDSRQIAELAGAVGLGAAGQVVERTVSRVLGGVAGGLLGGLLGGATALASAAAVTFSATYALGHAANQYYARGRTLTPDDLRALYAKLRADAEQLFPRLKSEIEARSRTLDVRQVLAGASGAPGA
jgi:uncharacterized protein (DUF697 family)